MNNITIKDTNLYNDLLELVKEVKKSKQNWNYPPFF